MAINFNGTIQEQPGSELQLAARALSYADGLFEAIRMSNNRMPWLELHLHRLYAGLTALRIEIPEDWTPDFWRHQIRLVAGQNARVRLQVWRAPGGLYFPEDDAPVFLISAQPLNAAGFEWQEHGLTLGLSNGVRLSADTYSGFKTLNTARYVAAALEAQAQGWDDALLLNARERVVESSSANLFWWANHVLYTIPLSEGCVAGITRKQILQIATGAGLPVQEKPVTFAALGEAEEIFLSNAVRGIIPVKAMSGRIYPSVKTKMLFDLLVAAFRKEAA